MLFRSETEETLRAIHTGEVDAIMIGGPAGPQVFILQTAHAEADRFRSDILGKVNDAVIAIDGEQRIIYLNAAAERQYRVYASEALGRHVDEIYQTCWSGPDAAAESAAALKQHGQWIGEHIHVLQNGRAIHVESSVSVLQNADGISSSGQLSVVRDITERSEVEKALRASEERYRMLFNSIEEGFCVIEMIFDGNNKAVDWIYLQTSPSFERHTGLSDAVGKRVRDLIPNHEESWFEIYGKVALTGKPIRFENHANGLNRWYEMCASRFGDPDSKQVAVLFNEITERKLAEETLRQNEALFARIIDQAPEGVYVIDDQFKVLQVSEKARPAFAHAEPVEGRNFQEVMHILWGEEIGSQLVAIFQNTLETGEPYVAQSFKEQRKDLGEDRSYEWETHRLSLPNGKYGVVCYFSDSTARTRAEEALRASEERANNVIQSITDGFITMDREWKITYLSARGAEILSPLRMTTTNVLGKFYWEQFPHTVGTPIETSFRQAMDEQVAVQFETFYPPLRRWFDVRAYPSLTGISIYFLDITERKEAENALRASEQALRVADRSKDEFLAMLAHELRNPLAPLRNAAEILKSPAADSATRGDAKDLILRQIENMSRMIDDLLDVSRITQGKIELKKEIVDLQSIFASAANAIRPACDANHHELTVSIPDEPILLDADPTRLEQVLGNLLGNACKYSGEGCHIGLTAELLPAEAPEEVVIRITDNGTGIDPELLPRIFDLFVQSSRTLDRAHGGLGIGLTIVHRLVKLHGGSIEALSDGNGKGTEFAVHLPVLSASLLPQTEPPAPATSARALRMLIVDDNRDSAGSMAMLQEIRGHTTRTAHTGPDAVTEAAEFLPEVVLLDIGLPGMDGFEVARELRKMPMLENAFLVALTGYGSDGDRERAKDAGFDEHLVKPADLEQLREWLRKRFPR